MTFSKLNLSRGTKEKPKFSWAGGLGTPQVVPKTLSLVPS